MAESDLALVARGLLAEKDNTVVWSSADQDRLRVVSGVVVPNPSQYKNLVLDEQWAGSAVDTTKWGMYSSPGHGGNGLRRPSAFSVANGQLIITALWDGTNIVSGGMSRKTTQNYGYYETRIRTELDTTGQLSGLALTYAASGNGTRDGENDFYETLRNPLTRNPFYSFIHYPDPVTGVNRQHRVIHGVDGTQWHTMGMEWAPDKIRIWRDGLLVWTLTNMSLIPKTLHKFCLQLDAFSNKALQGPVRQYVDYVRIYN